MEHLTKENLRDYLTCRLKESLLIKVEEHLAECAECSSRVRAEKLLQFAWNTLTAKTHGQAYWQAQLESALNEVAASPEYNNYKERLKDWISVWQNKAEAVLGLALEAASEKAQVITQGWESLTRPESKWGFAFGQTPVRGVEKGPITVESSGEPNVKVTVDSEKSSVTVLVRKIEAGRKPPLVLLIPESKDKKPLLAEPKQPQGSKQFVAQFCNVPSGKYLLVFEPKSEKE
jgi:hypothetical protein